MDAAKAKYVWQVEKVQAISSRVFYIDHESLSFVRSTNNMQLVVVVSVSMYTRTGREKEKVELYTVMHSLLRLAHIPLKELPPISGLAILD